MNKTMAKAKNQIKEDNNYLSNVHLEFMLSIIIFLNTAFC